jgi:drug/metabolite transporter (DMT)-like permease
MLPWLLLIGLIETFYMFPYFKAYKHLDTSIVSALFALSRIMTPILAFLFVHEVLGFQNYIGFFIIIGASVVLSLDKTSKFKVNRGFWLMLLASTMIVVEGVIYKQASFSMDWVSLFFWSCLAGSMASLLLLIPKSNRANVMKALPAVRSFAPWFLGVEFFQFIARGFHVFVLTVLPVTIFEAGMSFQPILVLITSLILCKLWKSCPINEDNVSNIRKFTCFLIMVLGAVLLIN